MLRLTASWDDGCASDYDVAELMSKYAIPAVFYWPVEWHSLAFDSGYLPLSYQDAKSIAGQFDIGAHTITHRRLTALAPAEARYEIAASKSLLEDIFGLTVAKFAPPRGYTNPDLTKFTLGHYKSQRLTKGPALVHVHPNSGVNDKRPWVEVLAEKDGDVEIWGHSWELDKYGLWEELEEVLSDLSS